MAQLRDTQTQQCFPLRAHHTVGRCTERSDTIISNPITSRLHLALEWDGQRWNARDLSKNGTWLGKNRLETNESTPLQVGDRLHLGAADMAPLELVDDAPPQSILQGIDGAPDIVLEPYVFLPDQHTPEAVVIYSYQHRSWMLHPIEEDSPQKLADILHHGDRLNYGNHQWQIFLTESEQSTEINQPPNKKLEEVEFVFDLSQDEEITSLRINVSNRELDLGERSHHYLLLHLARLRAMEASKGFDGKTQGWVDNEQIKRDLGMDMPHINIMIFRARKQIAESLAGTLDPELLVERGKGRMRFGGSRFQIFKGEQLSYALPAPAAS